MYEYFPDNYAWSNLAICALNTGGQISEVDEICAPLKALEDKTSAESIRAGFEAWRNMARRLDELAQNDEALGNALTASRRYFRATCYYLFAEMQTTARSADKIPTYRRAQATFRKAVTLSDEPVEFVDVPYEDTSLPALFIPAVTDRKRAPCVVHFDGFDWNKELLYCLERQDMAQRGVSLLIVDTPGVGEARRMRKLPLRTDTEVAGTACVDYLVTRDDVDPERIGVTGISMGGYYAPRAAAFENRFVAVAAWGALYDFAAVLSHEEEAGTESMPDQAYHAGWVIGEQDPTKKRAIFESLTLNGLLDKITVPFLILHGENDQQIPIEQARQSYNEAVNAPVRHLKIMSLAEGGDNHVQIDNMKSGADYIFDWLSKVLLADDPVKAAQKLKDLGM